VGARLLGRVNPVFAHLTSLDGRADATVDGARVPLVSPARGAVARGRFELGGMRVRPSGLLGELLALGGLPLEGLQPLRVTGMDFAVRDGRIEYDGLVLTFGETFELIFRGSVGFDDTLDLAVSVPVRVALLERFGVRGPVADYARLLSGLRVEIPLAGTRLAPRLDLGKVDLRPLIQRAVELLLIEQAARTLREVVGAGGPASRPAEAPDTQPRERTPLDLIFDILRPR